MDKLKYMYVGYEEMHPSLQFIGTDFDSVIFQVDDFTIGDDIPNTNDCMMNFAYKIIHGEKMVYERKQEFLDLLSRLVTQIVEDAVKDIE